MPYGSARIPAPSVAEQRLATAPASEQQEPDDSVDDSADEGVVLNEEDVVDAVDAFAIVVVLEVGNEADLSAVSGMADVAANDDDEEEEAVVDASGVMVQSFQESVLSHCAVMQSALMSSCGHWPSLSRSLCPPTARLVSRECVCVLMLLRAVVAVPLSFLNPLC